MAVLTVAAGVYAGTASAETITISGKLHVQSRVLPSHTITVDEDNIMQIASNTTEDVHDQELS